MSNPAPTPGLTAGRVNGEKKHSGSDAARTASLPDLRRWPGDGFFGKIPKSESRPRWKNPDLGAARAWQAGGFDARQVAVRSRMNLQPDRKKTGGRFGVEPHAHDMQNRAKKREAVPRVMQKTSCSTCRAKKQAFPHVMQKTSCSTCHAKKQAVPHAKTMQKPCKMRRVRSANPPNPHSPRVPICAISHKASH